MQENLHQGSVDNLCPQPEVYSYTLTNYITTTVNYSMTYLTKSNYVLITTSLQIIVNN